MSREGAKSITQLESPKVWPLMTLFLPLCCLGWTGLAGGEGRGDEWQNIPSNKKLNRVFAAIAKIAEKLRDKSLEGTCHQGKVGVEFGRFVSVGTVARF